MEKEFVFLGQTPMFIQLQILGRLAQEKSRKYDRRIRLSIIRNVDKLRRLNPDYIEMEPNTDKKFVTARFTDKGLRAYKKAVNNIKEREKELC